MSSTQTPPSIQSKSHPSFSQQRKELLFIARRNRELEAEAARAQKLSLIKVDSKSVSEIQRVLEVEKKVATRLLKEASGSIETCLRNFLEKE